MTIIGMDLYQFAWALLVLYSEMLYLKFVPDHFMLTLLYLTISGIFWLMQVSILFFTPLLSKIILLLKLQPQEFITGLTAENT